MRVCLVNPPTTADGESSYFPFALLALGAQLKASGLACDVVDLDLLSRQRRLGPHRGGLPRAVARVAATGADVVGITTICSNFPIALLIAKAVRAALPAVRIVLGGPHVSSVARETMDAYPFVDAVVVGEGEHTLVELCGSGFDPARLAHVSGLVFRQGETVVDTGPRPLVTDLDTLPFPDYSLVRLKDYGALPGVDFAPSVEAGRGCPFQCTFCSTKSMWARKFRIKSPARLLAEMERLHASSGYSYFPTIHDNFTTSKSYVHELCEYFAVHNRHGLKWGASSRTDCLDETRLDQLARAGCGDLFFGVESGSAGMQKRIRKGLNLDLFEPILDSMVARGIAATTSFILGFPEETEQDVDETILAGFRYKAAGSGRVFFTQLVPLPGTELTLRYFDQLCLSGEVTSISRHLRGGLQASAQRRLVRTDKRLFSSFYRFPTPHLPNVHVEHLAFFYKYCLAYELDLTRDLFTKVGVGPLDLFRRWRVFMTAHHPGLAAYDSAWESMSRFRTFCRRVFRVGPGGRHPSSGITGRGTMARTPARRPGRGASGCRGTC